MCIIWRRQSDRVSGSFMLLPLLSCVFHSFILHVLDVYFTILFFQSLSFFKIHFGFTKENVRLPSQKSQTLFSHSTFLLDSIVCTAFLRLMFQPLSYLFSGALSLNVSVLTSSSISEGHSGGLKSVLSVLGVLNPLHQPAPVSLCFNRAVYIAVSLAITPIPEGPSGQTGISTGTSKTSGSRTRGCGLSVGGSGDIGECRRDSGTFLPLERGLGYLQLGRAASGSKGGSSAARPPSWGPPGESCSKDVSCVTDRRWWNGIVAGLLDCLSTFSALSLLLCLGSEGGYNGKPDD